jgi:transposase-like protein
MKTNFKSLIVLNDYFKEEKTCFEFLASQIWDEGKPVCPFCGSAHVYTTKSRSTKPSKKNIPEYRCANKECTKKFSATTGTIFQSSKIPLRTWYAAIFLLTTSKKGISSVQLVEKLEVTQKTAWFLITGLGKCF